MPDSNSRLIYEPEERGSKVVIRRVAPHYTGMGEVIARRVELADAQTIVKAVNAHDELVAALTAARVHLVALGGDDRKMPASYKGDAVQAALLDVVDAALAKAEA